MVKHKQTGFKASVAIPETGRWKSTKDMLQKRGRLDGRKKSLPFIEFYYL